MVHGTEAINFPPIIYGIIRYTQEQTNGKEEKTFRMAMPTVCMHAFSLQFKRG
jgi:hypothetical protein